MSKFTLWHGAAAAVLSAVACAALAAPVPWVLSYAGKSSNRLIWDKRAAPLVRAHVPAALAGDVLAGLGGPPDPVRVAANRYVSMSACVAHACMDKGFFWIDSATGQALGAYVGGGVLRIGSRDFASGQVPPLARKALIDWLGENGVQPAQVQYIDRQGVSAALAAASFTPAVAFQPPKEGPSFDCTRAVTGVERAVCANPELAAQDLKVARLFREIRQGHDTLEARAELVAFQRKWLASRDAQCRDANDLAACLLDQYQSQYQRLMHWLPAH